MRRWEFWAVDEHGKKWHEYFKSKAGRTSKLKKLITKKYKINIEKCIDFGMRQAEL